MKRDRSRDKRGVHESIGGAPADEALEELIAQFSDPYAFVRELIQNSIDAGAARIEVRMAWADAELVVEVIDDGEGMDRPTIDGYLLTLFRSTKEGDLTKIGKFGIGFVSLFALDPHQVVVDTGRDGVWHRVEFGADRRYTLLLMPEPREGTTVRLVLRRDRQAAGIDCERIRDSAARWCRFVAADITTSAVGIRQPWDDTPIAAPFTVDAPVTITHRGDGLSAVLGPSRSPSVGFYRHGLTLWEASVALVPGVSFRVDSQKLEHTLTRDNVRRDTGFDEVLAKLHELAAAQLGAAVEQALAAGDVDVAKRVFAAVSPQHPWTWNRKAPLFPRVGGGRASLADLGAKPGLLRTLWGPSERPLWWAPPDDADAAAVAAAGHLVLAGGAGEDPHLAYAAERIGATPRSVVDAFRVARPPPPDPPRDAAVAAANDTSRAFGLPYEVHAAILSGGRVAMVLQEPFVVAPVGDGIVRGHHLMFSVDHPVWASLLRLPPAAAGPLLLRAAIAASGAPAAPATEAWIDRVRAGLGS